jgi:plasmid stabilization system protein ParE
MAFEIVWSPKAINGYNAIIEYLEANWTDREIRNFIKESDEVFELLKEYPEMFQKSIRYKTIYRGLLNRLTVVTYRIQPRKKQIQLLNIRGTRQKPKA